MFMDRRVNICARKQRLKELSSELPQALPAILLLQRAASRNPRPTSGPETRRAPLCEQGF